MLELASRLEGHPDNVAACLLGGLTIAWHDDAETVHAIRVNLDPSISPYLLRPADAVVDQGVPQVVAARGAARRRGHNAARAALLVAALTGSVQATDDDREFDNDPCPRPRRASVLLAPPTTGCTSSTGAPG